MFDKMKELLDIKKKAEELKRKLEAVTFEISSIDGLVKITMNGSQEVQDLRIQGDLEKDSLEKALKDVYNRAIKRSHELAAQKMKEITGFNLPGLT
ncbi:MAG: YbaB/EbfC family nucleoid-associated protein [Candidatus Omnitrophica bacterium]|nr:YbaB/EbfC family nucleoid-associated protein [Candidatus Omnitrophota bacterium]